MTLRETIDFFATKFNISVSVNMSDFPYNEVVFTIHFLGNLKNKFTIGLHNDVCINILDTEITTYEYTTIGKHIEKAIANNQYEKSYMHMRSGIQPNYYDGFVAKSPFNTHKEINKKLLLL